MEDKLNITLKIGGLEIKTKINREDEEITRLAAKELDRYFDLYNKRINNREQALVYTALLFAVSYYREKNEDFLGHLAGEISELNASLQEFIEQNINS